MNRKLTRFEQNKEDSWKIVVICIGLMILCLFIGAGISLFDGEVNHYVPHRSIDIKNDGTTTIITGTLHRYNGNEYMKVKRVLTLPSIDATEKTVQRMSEELDRYEMYFNKEIRSE